MKLEAVIAGSFGIVSTSRPVDWPVMRRAWRGARLSRRTFAEQVQHLRASIAAAASASVTSPSNPSTNTPIRTELPSALLYANRPLHCAQRTNT